LGVDTVWQVFELVVDGTGNVTVTALNTYVLNVSAGAVTAPGFNVMAKKKAFTSWNW
jgi:hypothetical protein